MLLEARDINANYASGWQGLVLYLEASTGAVRKSVTAQVNIPDKMFMHMHPGSNEARTLVTQKKNQAGGALDKFTVRCYNWDITIPYEKGTTIDSGFYSDSSWGASAVTGLNRIYYFGGSPVRANWTPGNPSATVIKVDNSKDTAGMVQLGGWNVKSYDNGPFYTVDVLDYSIQQEQVYGVFSPRDANKNRKPADTRAFIAIIKDDFWGVQRCSRFIGIGLYFNPTGVGFTLKPLLHHTTDDQFGFIYFNKIFTGGENDDETGARGNRILRYNFPF